MLIERWERFRGIDRWPEVQATITDKRWRYQLSRSGAARRRLASINVDYRSADDVLRSKRIRFWGRDCGLDVGDWFYIRCSPEDPSKIYVRESTQAKLAWIAGLGIFVLVIWLLVRYR